VIQLLAYRFGAEADFEGRLLGALERLESGGTLRIVDTLFLYRDADGEVSAIGQRGGGVGRIVAPVLEFRLDPGARRRATRAALGDAEVEALARTLAPGSGIAAVLVEHVWVATLADAVSRSGGTPLANEAVEVTELTPALLAPMLARAPSG
jgi:hypothetical protein